MQQHRSRTFLNLRFASRPQECQHLLRLHKVVRLLHALINKNFQHLVIAFVSVDVEGHILAHLRAAGPIAAHVVGNWTEAIDGRLQHLLVARELLEKSDLATGRGDGD